MYVTVGVSGCSDRQKRKEQRHVDAVVNGSDDTHTGGVRAVLLFHNDVLEAAARDRFAFRVRLLRCDEMMKLNRR